MLIFKNPLWFLLLLVLIPVIWKAFIKNPAALVFSDISYLKKIKKSFKIYTRHLLTILRCLIIILITIALARPQKGKEDSKIFSEGIDIMLTIDASGSMIAEDLEIGQRKNRLDVVKEVTKQFIEARPSDRIGLVVYGKDAYMQCPLTLDHGTLNYFLNQVKIGTVDENGTAIGDGLATSILRLRDSQAKSKIIVLLTDGVNNSGSISPEVATQIAKKLGIKIYTIGAGTDGIAPVPGIDMFGNRILQQVQVEIDTNLLAHISAETSAAFFRATDKNKLAEIYNMIDNLEKTETETFNYMEWTEYFQYFVIAAGCLLLLELLLRHTVFRLLP